MNRILQSRIIKDNQQFTEVQIKTQKSYLVRTTCFFMNNGHHQIRYTIIVKRLKTQIFYHWVQVNQCSQA